MRTSQTRRFYAQGGPFDHQVIESQAEDGETVILEHGDAVRHVYRAERNTSPAVPAPADGLQWDPQNREFVRWSLWHVGPALTESPSSTRTSS